MTRVLDRDALYYPRIHIRDPLWLKQTLLCFPQVRRMIPVGYPLNDVPQVRAFRDLTGPRGEPLLSEEDVYGSEVYQAQARLAERLRAQPEHGLRSFTREATRRRFGRDPDAFQIHRGKLMDVLGFLEPRGLAWSPDSPRRDEWIAVHPQVGNAIMSFIAIAIADAKGLDIVTDVPRVHLAVATRSEDAVFEELISGRWSHPRVREGSTESAEELIQVVIRSCFDVSKLTPIQIAELVRDGKDLRSFKETIAPLAATIPTIRDPQERAMRFRVAAAEVIDQWRSYKKSLPRFALDAIVRTADIKPPELLGTLASGLSGSLFVGVGGALIFGFVAYAGLGIIREWRERQDSPYKYLTRIHRAGAVLTIAR